MNTFHFAWFLVSLMFLPETLVAQQIVSPADMQPKTIRLSFAQFLSEVAQNNLEYAAQRFNVSIAQAQIAKAKVFPNPIAAASTFHDVSGQNMPSTVALSLTQTFLTGGKHRANIEVARKNSQVASATLDDFFRNLRATAANAYVDALAAQLTLEQKQRSADSLERLVEANEKRFRAGDLAEIDLVQSRVEARQFQNEVLAAQSSLQTAVIALSQFLGPQGSAATIIPEGRLDVPPKNFIQRELLEEAFQKRPDVVSAHQALEASHLSFKLAKANRIPDVDIGVGWQRSFASNNEIAPSPRFDLLGVSLSVPIPVLNTLKAELDMARFAREQAEKTFQSVRLKAEVEIRQAYVRNQLATERVAKYQKGVLRDSAAVLQAKLYSYERGHASLLEVLNAQRDENNVYLAYYDSLTEYAKALIALEQAAGIWDLNFESR